MAAPANGLPPPPMTATMANCDAPVNMSSDKAVVCHSERPEAVEMAPNDTA